MRPDTAFRLPPLQIALVLAALAHVALLWVLKPTTPTDQPRPYADGRDLEIALMSPPVAAPAPVHSPAAGNTAPAPVARGDDKNQDPSPAPDASSKALPAGPAPAAAPTRSAPARLSSASLSQQIADVTADLNRHRDQDLHSRKIVYLKDLQEHKALATAYEQAWQDKVERIGNLNYPEQARKEQITGSLTLAVAIRPDGSLYSIRVLRSSGQPVLDEAAKNIVQLSAPFAPFPDDLEKEAGILVITRTWRFLNDHHLETRGD